MSSKHTLLSLCNIYDKIEVPIIQRDYAQGRDTDEVKTLRNRFINDYLIVSLLSNSSTELDFVYGLIINEENKEDKTKIFIPLDGQQRLTTLFLLHYFIAVKENSLGEIKHLLSKFTYETRPSAHDFCTELLKFERVDNIRDIRNEIIDCVWFNNDWLKDSTVSGMLNMLDTFASNEELLTAENILLDRLLSSEKQLISFYYTDLDEFGLNENLYIRMNARGKMLTNFENFKSEFFKIINYDSTLLEQVKDKIEYEWVTNLWQYREKDTYIIDFPFMNFLSFITEMLYFKNAEYRSPTPYETNFLDFNLLKKIYSKEENLKFLIFSLDKIPFLQKQEDFIYWDNLSLNNLLNEIIKGKKDIEVFYIVYSAFTFLFKNNNEINLYDYLRVVRNLIVNTNDNSRREWPRLLNSLHKLISNENIYETLYKDDSADLLQGFLVSQKDEEKFKAKLICEFPNEKNNIFKYEDNKNFSGRIKNLLFTPFCNNVSDYNSLKYNSISYSDENFKILSSTYDSYEVISENDFNPIWGNFINTELYSQTYDSRLNFSTDYKMNPSVLLFAKDFSKYRDAMHLEYYVTKIQKDFINELSKKFDDFSEIRNVKHQLYLYYIIHQRLYDKNYLSFFKNGYYNFGWLPKVTGFKSHYSNGIEGCANFPDKNPIFQVYNQQFRYNIGLKDNNALDEEIVGKLKKRDLFTQLKNWAQQSL